MSTLTRDPRGFFGNPRLTRPSARGASQEPGRWHWPDPEMVAPPEVEAPFDYTASSPETLDGLWPDDPPMDSWPPFMGGAARDADLVEPEHIASPSRSTQRAHVSDPAAAQFRSAPVRHPNAGAPVGYAQEQTSHAPLGFAAASLAGGAANWAQVSAIPAEPAARRDPSPSRLAYRLNRLWLTPVIRGLVKYGLPLALTFGFAALWFSDAERRAELWNGLDGLRVSFENQAIFQVNALEVQSRSPEVVQGVEQLLTLNFPVSSFQLDPTELRARIEALDVVERASVSVTAGTVRVRIDERIPAMVWRRGDGLNLVDAGGHRVARLGRRDARADLPLIAGAGAPDAIAEAQRLFAAAAPLQGRMRGLVRVGERRWDLVLDRGQRIFLPETDALAALERVLALDTAQQLLSRDIQVVDMRNPARPVLRLSQSAMQDLTQFRQP